MFQFEIAGYVNDEGERMVKINGTKIPTHQEVADHSDEFGWGYRGSGPLQAAAAIICEIYGPHRVRDLKFRFRDDFLLHLEKSRPWRITPRKLADWEEKLEKEGYDLR